MFKFLCAHPKSGRIVNQLTVVIKWKKREKRRRHLKTFETSYPHDSTLTKRFVVKITVERCDEFLVAVPQIFNRVKSVALWSAKKKKEEKKDHKGLRFRS
jgi:hypothetical protein